MQTEYMPRKHLFSSQRDFNEWNKKYFSMKNYRI